MICAGWGRASYVPRMRAMQQQGQYQKGSCAAVPFLEVV